MDLSGWTGGAGKARALARDMVAGTVAAVVLVANIVSFAALMFPGPLAQGAAAAIWALLIGSGIAGIVIAWKTSLPPLATGIDSPTGAVLVLLAAMAGAAVLRSGGGPQAAIQATMLLFSAATLLVGLLTLGLGAARWAHFLRFVPYFVVAGFLAATGWLLVAGGVRMTTGRTLADLTAAWTAPEAARLASAVAVLLVLLALRRWVRLPLALPLALLGMCLGGALALRALGLSGAAQGWYLPSLGALQPWHPLEALRAAPLSLSTAVGFLPELVAAAVIAVISLVTKTSSLEVSRKAAGDLDVELRTHGLATLAVVPFGGITALLQLGTSRLLEQAGGATRWSGAAAGVVLIAVALANFDLPALIPLPVAAGIAFFLGCGFLFDALSKSLAQRDALNLLLTLAIMAACVRYGYLAGVIGGVVGACLLFAVSYARIGAVRQHLSRAQFAGNVSRSADASRHLAQAGEAVQIYWLSGYIFFGSSEGVFERVRQDLRARPPRQVSHVILDFSAVSAADASATVSLAKLHNLCEQQGATLVLSSMPPSIRGLLEREGLVGGKGRPPPFADVTGALAWCEDRVLAEAGLDTGAGAATGGPGTAAFEAWLQQQLGAESSTADFLRYLVRHDVDDGQVLYREGEPADAIDFVAAGRLAIDVGAGVLPARRVRSISTHTVVGEMGFFRRVPRSATVSAEGPATVFTLTRENFERMRSERPDLAGAFSECLLRTLADRIVLSDRMVAALSR
ncbi:MAG: STAS domain-containing protein [Rubrivivax sp.]|nr:STAS domain-containing protein [Rubrivivax sp.]